MAAGSVGCGRRRGRRNGWHRCGWSADGFAPADDDLAEFGRKLRFDETGVRRNALGDDLWRRNRLGRFVAADDSLDDLFLVEGCLLARPSGCCRRNRRRGACSYTTTTTSSSSAWALGKLLGAEALEHAGPILRQYFLVWIELECNFALHRCRHLIFDTRSTESHIFRGAHLTTRAPPPGVSSSSRRNAATAEEKLANC